MLVFVLVLVRVMNMGEKKVVVIVIVVVVVAGNRRTFVMSDT